MLRLIAPMVHLNGDRQQTLLDANQHAIDNLRMVIVAMEDASPNARNYYPIRPETLTEHPASVATFQRAAIEHNSRMDRLRSVLLELEALQEAIVDGKTEACL